jgi:hypothetical protein
MLRGLSPIVRAELARDQARRAREVAASVRCPTLSERLEACALAWDVEADRVEAYLARPTRLSYWNETDRHII